MLQAPAFASLGNIPSVACTEWIVCKNHTANREGKLSDSHVQGQGVCCRQGSAGIKAGLLQGTEKKQEQAVPQVFMHSAPIQVLLFSTSLPVTQLLCFLALSACCVS